MGVLRAPSVRACVGPPTGRRTLEGPAVTCGLAADMSLRGAEEPLSDEQPTIPIPIAIRRIDVRGAVENPRLSADRALRSHPRLNMMFSLLGCALRCRFDPSSGIEGDVDKTCS